MFYLLISFLSFILLSKSFARKRLPPWEGQIKLVSAFFICWFQKNWHPFSFFQTCKISMPFKNIRCSRRTENKEEKEETSFLDLPELALDSILERLLPAELCKMAGVCSYLRDFCESDHFWKKHMEQKWSRLVGNSACQEWHLRVDRRRRSNCSGPCQKKSFFSSFFGGWTFLLKRPKPERQRRSCLEADSMKAWYLSLESGKLWFPAQVFNREGGHAGFMLSCYDAQVCYDSQTDTFKARYLPRGRRVIEENIHWDRLRAPPVKTPPHVLHVSDCLTDLKPEDHIEIQWRKSTEFSYGWWYGVVGHLETCHRNVNDCHCCYSDKVMLEFRHYTIGSRWRRTVINRESHREEGNEADGFYGGIRKLYNEDEITRWKCLWPTRLLE